MKFRLMVVRGQPCGKCLLFPPGEFVIGRGTECHIRPQSKLISRQHCLLRVTRTGATIRDLGSSNGTLVNGVRVVGERPLVDGDKVQLGQLVFEARLEESILISRTTPVPLGDEGEAPHLNATDDVSTALTRGANPASPDNAKTDEVPSLPPPE
jgi:pSer/pThr/pTyr-binding forkhead associated (FHA) protein